VRASNPEKTVEGITDRLKEQLQCRKKLYPGQTEAEKWQQMYRLLFPNEIVPSPCKSTFNVELWNFQFSTAYLMKRFLVKVIYHRLLY
jgi:hypothetical protein